MLDNPGREHAAPVEVIHIEVVDRTLPLWLLNACNMLALAQSFLKP